MAITGRGDASKEQVRVLMEKTLGIKMESAFLDASDALAIAMCHFYQLISPLVDVSASSNWKSFVESHPTRVKK